MHFKSRIIQYLEYKGISQYKFSSETGFARGILGKKGGLTEENIMRFINWAKDVNHSWFLTGEGDMLNQNLTSDNNESQESAEVQEIKELNLSLSDCKKEKEELQRELQEVIKDSSKVEGKFEYVREQLIEKEELAEQRKGESDKLIQEKGQLQGRVQELENQMIEALTRLKRHEDISGFLANGTTGE